MPEGIAATPNLHSSTAIVGKATLEAARYWLPHCYSNSSISEVEDLYLF